MSRLARNVATRTSRFRRGMRGKACGKAKAHVWGEAQPTAERTEWRDAEIRLMQGEVQPQVVALAPHDQRDLAHSTGECEAPAHGIAVPGGFDRDRFERDRRMLRDLQHVAGDVRVDLRLVLCTEGSEARLARAV